MGKKIAVNIETLINKGFPIQKSKIIFKEILNSIENTHYSEKLEKMFNYAIDNDPSLFTNISVENTEISIMVFEYLTQWCKKYIIDRENPAIKRPLKTYGERDTALVERIASTTGADSKTLQNYLIGHYIYMSAENMNGAILEEFLAQVLEPYGWIWCAGSTFRAIDFCYINNNQTILLQVKNKYNTENSSSSAIRSGTEIKKWNRLKRPNKTSGLYTPIPNWEELINLVDAPESLKSLLTEEKYLEYIRNNSTKEIDTLD